MLEQEPTAPTASALGPNELVSKPQRAVSTTTGRCRTTGEPRNPLAGGNLLYIPKCPVVTMARAYRPRTNTRPPSGTAAGFAEMAKPYVGPPALLTSSLASPRR